MPGEKPHFELFSQIDSANNERERLKWEGNFGEYFERVLENPHLARTSHRSLYEAVTAQEDFFQTGNNALFGAEKTTNKLTEVLKAAAEGLEPSRRIILLMGPVGGGKSTLVTALKRGLEQYSRTDEGAVFAIADCPMHEDPLHLVPQENRESLEEHTGIHIEGDLCPHCYDKYGKKGNVTATDLREVPVKRVLLSEKDRVGIGTFAPSDPKSQDISELIGSVDFSKLPEHGTASDPRAYRFDGELNIANRGLMEFIEMLKSDEKFLYTLLTATQEKVIKVGRFPNISVDEVIVAHTNETEYKNFTAAGKNEALKDRMIVIPAPYNLRVSDEERIYDKLIRQSALMRRGERGESGQEIRGQRSPHISPNALRTAAMFAVLSRLQESKKANMGKMQKLKLYDGQQVDGVSPRDLKELQEEFPREGMEGISPRYVIDSLSTALIKEGRTCLDPIATLRALRDNLDYHPHSRDLPDDKKKGIIAELVSVRQEYDEVAKKEVQSAFVHAFESSATTLCNTYLDNIDAYVNKEKIKDPYTDEEVDPDERVMRSIEEQIGISDNGKNEFRNEVVKRIAQLARRGQPFDYESHPRLKEAIEKKLFADMKDVIKLTTSSKTPDPEQQKRIGDVQERLIAEKGYCPDCSSELIKYVGQLLNR